jgi:hypothetical protein
MQGLAEMRLDTFAQISRDILKLTTDNLTVETEKV